MQPLPVGGGSIQALGLRSMHIARRIALGTFIASLAASLAASMLFGARAALWSGLPALLFSTWAAIGHLVTIDDDAPGEWSNPESSPRIWRNSLGELAIKILVAILVAWLVVGAPLAQHEA